MINRWVTSSYYLIHGKLFGFKIEDESKDNSKGIVSPVPRTDEDSSDYYVSSGFYGQYVDIDGVYKSESFDLIKRYREMAASSRSG